MENCGDDFIAALADATQTTDDWDDLNAIETEACGNLNEMMKKGVNDEKGGVVLDTPLFKRADFSSQHNPNGLKALSCSSDDSDFDIFDETETRRDNSVGIQKKAKTRNSIVQTSSSTKSTVSLLS